MTTTVTPPQTTRPELSVARINLMRVGYAFMGIGLALVKWPLLPEAHTLPLYEGVTLALLTAMSLLAWLGLRYPVKMLPVLLFETTWKLLWLPLVALPATLHGDMSAAMTTVMINCFFVAPIIAVIPWRYVWNEYVRASGDRWRR